MNDRHEFFVEVGEYTTVLIVKCPYDRADAGRPCWPYHEDGEGGYTEPDSPPQEHCTYEDWADNCAAEDVLHGARVLPLGPVDIEWDDGALTVHLGKP